MTRNGTRILEMILHTNVHLTAEEVFLRLKEAAPKVAMATVYNNLNALCEEGLIRKISVPGSPDRYDKPTRHDHLVCRQCGALADISFEDLTQTLSAQLGEPIFSYDLKVSYLCPRCRQMDAQREPNLSRVDTRNQE